MGSFLDISGQRFGRLIAKNFEGCLTDSKGRKHSHWKCLCDCGQETSIATNSLKKGLSKSCGCLRNELASERNRVNGSSISERKFNKYYKGIIGETFGFLTVLEVKRIFEKQRSNFLCRCACGNIQEHSATSVINGQTTSCGCRRIQTLKMDPIGKGQTPWNKRNNQC